MTTIGIFYGSTDGNTARIAAQMAEQLRQILAADGKELTPIEIDLVDIGEFHIDELERYDLLLFGIPTWDHGQLQRDWEEAIDDLAAFDLTDTPTGIFGLGDQGGYPATFVDAMFFLTASLRNAGASLLGRWPLVGYAFDNSWAVEDDMFVGLVLDEVNQPALTSLRIERWLTIVLAESGLGSTPGDRS